MKLVKYSIFAMFLASGAALAEEGSIKSIEMNQKFRANQELLWEANAKITDRSDQVKSQDEAKLVDKIHRK
ncbi:hypothetical protein D3C77_622860 [compost metagenome]